MRDTRWQKMLRDLWQHRGRSLTTLAAMSAGLFGSSLVLNSWSLVDAATHGGYDATNPPAATLRLASPHQLADADVLAEARAVPGVVDAALRRTVVTRATLRGVSRTAMLYASSDLHTQAIGQVEHVRGTWPLRASAVALDYSVLEFAGVDIGDSVSFAQDGVRVTLPVSTVVRDAGLPPGWMDHVVYLFVTTEVLQQTLAPVLPQPVTELRITMRRGSTDAWPTREATQAMSRAVVDRLAARGVAVTHAEIPEPGQHAHAGQIESFLLIQGVFGVVALLLSALLIVNLLSAMLLSQQPLVGVMKAMGATPRQLTPMYLTQAAVLGGVSALVALPLAAVLGYWYADFLASLLNFSVDGFAVPWPVFAAELATAVLLPVLAALVPVRRACGMSVAQALHPRTVLHTLPQLTWLPDSLRTYPAVTFALRNLWRHQRRVVFTVLSLASGGAVFLGGLQLRRSIQDSVAVLYEQTIRYDAVLRSEQPTAIHLLDSLARSVPGVARAESWPSLRAAIVADGRLENRFTITAPTANTPLLDMRPSPGRWLRTSDSTALVVSRELADAEPSLALGSWVSLMIDGVARRWQVVGVAAVPGRVAYANQAFVTTSLGVQRASSVLVQFAARSLPMQEPTLRAVQSALEAGGVTVSSAQPMTEARSAAEDHLVMVVDFLIVAAQLTIVVAAFGLASTLGLAVLERTREIGVLRAVGASPRSIMAVVQGEGLAIAAVSAMVAIPLSLPMSLALGAAFGRMMFPVPVSLLPVGGSVLLWFVVALGVAALAGIGPSRRAMRISAREAMRD